MRWEPDDIRDFRSRISSNIALLNSFSDSFTREQVASLVKGQDQLTRWQDQQHRQEILDWLTPIDYAAQQSDFVRRRQTGTGQWLLDSKEYQQWVAAKKETLFCPGVPGAGKTMMASIVVDHLHNTFRVDDSIGICYIYCSFRNTDKQNLDDLMAALLKQLLYSRSLPLGGVRDLYDLHRERHTRPSMDELRKTLHSLAMGYSRLFVVVDALDECQTSDGCQSRFISELLALQSTMGANILATSRISSEIATRFDGAVLKEIRAIDDDIGKYLDSNLSHLAGIVSRDPALQREIKQKIMRCADGM